jgi:hypothetical protein
MTSVQEEAWQFYGDYGEADYPSMSEGIFALKALECGQWKSGTEITQGTAPRVHSLCATATSTVLLVMAST